MFQYKGTWADYKRINGKHKSLFYGCISRGNHQRAILTEWLSELINFFYPDLAEPLEACGEGTDFILSINEAFGSTLPVTTSYDRWDLHCEVIRIVRAAICQDLGHPDDT